MAEGTSKENSQPSSTADSSTALDVDERRSLVLTHCAKDVWNRAGKDINKVLSAFEEASEWRSDSNVLECCFQSIEICLLNTYAMKCPVMIATAKEGAVEVLFIALVEGEEKLSPANSDRSIDDTSNEKNATCSTCTISGSQSNAEHDPDVGVDLAAFTMSDVQRRLTGPNNVRIVLCGEGRAALIAQRLACVLLSALPDVARRRLKCVSIACPCVLAMPECQTPSTAPVFTSLLSAMEKNLLARQRSRLRSLEPEASMVGRHLVVRSLSGNLTLTQREHIDSFDEQDLPNLSRMELYLSASKKVIAHAGSSGTLTRWGPSTSCALCSLPCKVTTSVCSASVEPQGDEEDARELLEKALKTACLSADQRSASYEEALPKLNDEPLHECLKRLEEEADRRFQGLDSSSMHEERPSKLTPTKENFDRCKFTEKEVGKRLDEIAAKLTSPLPCVPNTMAERVKQVWFSNMGSSPAPSGTTEVGGTVDETAGEAAGNAAAAAATPGLLGKLAAVAGVKIAASGASTGVVAGAAAAAAATPFLVMTAVAAPLVGAAAYWSTEKKRQDREAKMTWEERNKRYRQVLWSLLDKPPEDHTWEHLSARQLEAMLTVQDPGPSSTANKLACKWFDYVMPECVEEALSRIKMAKAMYELRRCLSHTCHIAVVGPQNAGKSTLVMKVWQRRDIKSIGISNHTTKASMYMITKHLKASEL